jgi:ATP-binding cassette subfamily C (CFTR/MRP) protein 5
MEVRQSEPVVASKSSAGRPRTVNRPCGCMRAMCSGLGNLLEHMILCTSRSTPYVKEANTPFGRAGVFSRIYFTWASPLITHIATSGLPVSLADLWELRTSETAADSVDQLNTVWADEQLRARAIGRQPSFAKAAFRTIRWSLLKVCIFKLGWLIFSLISNALLLGEVIAYFSSDKPLWYGIILVFCFLLSETFRSICVNQHWLIATLMGIRLRAAARQMMYDKALRIPQTRVTVGTAVNMLMNDTQRLSDACQYGEFVISTPITVIATLVIMWLQLGPSALAGFVVLIIFTPIQAWIGERVGSLRRRTVKITDERAKTMAEVLNGIKLLKLYAWEAAFADKVANIRRREIAALRQAAFIRAANSVVAFSVPVLVTLATFATYTLWTGDPLKPAAAFVCIALFNVARFPLGIMPLATKQISEAYVACQRLQSLLQQPDISAADQPVLRNGVGEDARWKANTDEELPPGNVVVAARSASYEWRMDYKSPFAQPATSGKQAVNVVPVSTLEGESGRASGISNISFDIHSGECVGIIGPVGSGKTSLLAALLGQLSRRSGSLLLNGEVAYASQSPWVFGGTIRENIIFGNPVDEQRYQEVVRVCALEADFAMFTSGDESEIGERGINLSGGQKSRIGLARAVYADRPINFLDDPLSAVDVHVGKHLWEQCIQGYLVRRGKTVVIVTHQLQYMHGCSTIFHMDKGQIATQGSFQDLINSGFDFAVAGVAAAAEPDVEPVLDAQVRVPTIPLPAVVNSTAPPTAKLVDADAASSSNALVAISSGKPASATGKLVAEEEKNMGSVSGKTLTAYFSAAGSAWLVLYLLVILLLSKGARLVSDWWLSYWTTHTNNSSVSEQHFYLGIYAATALAVLVFTIIQSGSFAVVTLQASRVFHDRVFTSMMRAQSSWLDTQPTGRILSRFTGDMDLIDSAMPPNIEQASEYQVQVLLSIVLIIAVFPWFLIPLVPIAATFTFIAQYFRKAARDLKRIDNVARSPLVSHIQATMQGLENIRAYGRLTAFATQNRVHVDNSSRSYWAFYAANRWVAVRLDVQTTLIAVVTVILCVAANAAGGLTPSLAGLAIVQALQTTGIFQYSVRLLTETESQFTCVERLDYYTYKIPHESVTVSAAMTEAEAAKAMTDLPDAAAGNRLQAAASTTMSTSGTSCGFPAWYPNAWNKALVAASWPSRGQVVFNDVCVRYRDELPLVLQKVSFTMQPGFKVGCVGRTGSGKSTTTLALFRMLELASGNICIDGVDISRVNIYHLRSRLAIIPQDPTLYSGSLRANLDVFGQYTDEQVNEAVRKGGLSDFVASHPDGLKHEILEGGSNVSLGERQLVALTRALLRDAKVIVMDEATASVDTHTDAAIQRTIRHNMSSCTLFIIAHRLHTIMDCDRVLVLDKGRVAEYDAPAALLHVRPACEAGRGNGEPSIFESLVNETGPDMSSALRDIAVRAYDSTVVPAAAV